MIKNTLNEWSNIQNEIRNIFIKELNIKKNQRILIMCCGKGDEAFRIRKLFGENIEIVGIDIDKNSIDFAENKRKIKKYNNIKFINGDATVFDNTLGKFDKICCLFSIHYFNNYKNVILMWEKYLKSSGNVGIVNFLKSNNNIYIDKIYKISKNYLKKRLNIKNIILKNEIKFNFNDFNIEKKLYYDYKLKFINLEIYWNTIKNNTYFKNFKYIMGKDYSKFEKNILDYIKKQNNKVIEEKFIIEIIYLKF